MSVIFREDDAALVARRRTGRKVKRIEISHLFVINKENQKNIISQRTVLGRAWNRLSRLSGRLTPRQVQ